MRKKNTEVEWVSDRDALASRAVEILVNEASSAINQRGRFTLALSGGRTPRRIFELLADPTRSRHISWKDWHIFWGDERYVDYADPESSFGAAQNLLFSKIEIPKANIHPMPILPGAFDLAAQVYEKTLRQFFSDEVFPAFDFMLQGIGTDGHTASLFPDDSALNEMSKLCVPIQIQAQSPCRLTLTIPVFNAARFILFLASGKEKSSIVHRAMTEHNKNLPASLIKQKNGRVLWLCDFRIKLH